MDLRLDLILSTSSGILGSGAVVDNGDDVDDASTGPGPTTLPSGAGRSERCAVSGGEPSLLTQRALNYLRPLK